MRRDEIVARLEANRDVVRALYAGVTREDAAWRPAPGRWSFFEVINHLAPPPPAARLGAGLRTPEARPDPGGRSARLMAHS